MLNSSLVLSQQAEFVDGKLVNSKTQEPIPYASIRIKNADIGVISNFDGGFKIPLNFIKIEDTLEISSIGYKTKIALLSSFQQNQTNTILLTEHIEALNEVVVVTSKKRKRLKAKEIVRLAIKRIDENFPTKSFSYVGYYRDYQLKDTRYLNLNEAVLAVFDEGFGTEDLKDTQIRIYNYLENSNFLRDSIAAQNYDYSKRRKIVPKATMSGRIGNEYTRLRLHDALRNYNINTYSFVGRLDRDFIKNHKLRLLEDTFVNETPLYRIKISKVLDNIEVTGKIYIGKENFAIHKLEYAVYEKGAPKYQKGPFLNIGVKTMENGKRGKLLYAIKAEYRSWNDKMYLNYISFNNAFNILLPPKFIPLAAEIDSQNKRFKLIMNNPPLEKDAVMLKNYNLYYQKQKLTIKNIKIKKNTIYLYPNNEKVVFDPKLVQYYESRNLTGVAIEIKNVKDIYGNVVHESEAIHYNQFREFFTQKIFSETKKPADTLYMKKTVPLTQNQPIVSPSSFSDYWMNTPLKN